MRIMRTRGVHDEGDDDRADPMCSVNGSGGGEGSKG